MGRVLIAIWILMLVFSFFGIIEDLIKGNNFGLNGLGLSMCIYLYFEIENEK